MKTLHLAIIFIAIVVTVIITILSFLELQNNIDKQNQLEKNQARVHILTDNGTRFVKIDEMAPNSSLFLVYPFAGNETSDIEAFHRWILIRLPIHDGGDKEDISSYRAYSAVDIQLWCLIKYFPQHEWLEDPCHGSFYEPVYGIPFAGPAINFCFKNNALPQLDLGVDNDGYIYVKPPIFEIDKNGKIGCGRKLPPDLIEKYREIGEANLKMNQ